MIDEDHESNLDIKARLLFRVCLCEVYVIRKCMEYLVNKYIDVMSTVWKYARKVLIENKLMLVLYL